MIKGKLIESIRQEILRQQPNQDSNKFAHFLTIEVEIGKAYNTMLKEFYDNDRNLENAELDFFAKNYYSIQTGCSQQFREKQGIHLYGLPNRK